MNILVIVGYCLRINSSANLCHLSYINGLIDAGHSVDLVTVSPQNLNIDTSMYIPKVHMLKEYKSSKYEQLGAKKRKSMTNNKIVKNQSFIVDNEKGIYFKLKQMIKSLLRKLYGVYGTDIVWYLHARHFSSEQKYDCVLSLAYPPVSHLLAEKLIQRKRIHTDKWIQVWEDPWYADIYGLSCNEKVKKEEERLLCGADKICYVSPLTLMYQKQVFTNSKEKMMWQPLPSYYRNENADVNFSKLTFGYFGDYNSEVRNLKPFYDAAIKLDLEVNICGSSDCVFDSINNINIHPRMPLLALKEFEDKTNVLVFVCNLKGGQIPGKIYQYSSTSKMILFILDGTEDEQKEIRDYFSKFDRYIFCQNTQQSICKAINSLERLAKDEHYRQPLEVFAPKQIVRDILEG